MRPTAQVYDCPSSLPESSAGLDAELASLLVALGTAVRARILDFPIDDTEAAKIIGRRGGDTIFGLDVHVEEMMLAQIRDWPESVLPVAVFAEGLSETSLWIGPSEQSLRYWLLIDPIDGTRGLAYGKRSAFFLAAAAYGHLATPRLSDSVVSVAVELPTPKQAVADTFVWRRGMPPTASRTRLATGENEPPPTLRPSEATSVDQGFGCVVAYFPEGKQLSAALAEHIAQGTGSGDTCAQIFDDQFMSSSGQMLELLTGRDRFVIDLRPRLSAPSGGQSAHPYDLALTALVQAAGVVLVATDGAPLDAAYGLEEEVSWCGYANRTIAAQVHPLVEGWLDAKMAEI